jgi:hypothetical protein
MELLMQSKADWNGGTVNLRYNSRLHHIGLGAAHRGTRVTLLL